MTRAMTAGMRSHLPTRNPTACEHCRAARIRCHSSEQPGVCDRCFTLKRECVTRTKSRPRRHGRTTAPEVAESIPKSPAHLGTFSINYAVPVQVESSHTIDALRSFHDDVLTSILFEGESSNSSESATPFTSLSNRSKLSQRSDVDANSWRQPLFDMASAEDLLKSFRSTLTYLPFIKLPDDITIPHLAATKAFVLLAILTVASGSSMVQKYPLYDDEFRKALSLKYVSGGERSLELLQGLLIYCAWYPFHLRPKDRQLDHCLRIAGDLVHDMHLDKDLLPAVKPLHCKVTENKLDKIRACLAYLYLTLTYVVVWRGERDLPLRRPSWISIATETLQLNAQDDGDIALVALVRTSSLFADVSETIQEQDAEVVTNCQSILRRLEQEFLGFQPNTSHITTGLETIRMQVMFVDIFLDCGNLLVLPVSRTYSTTKNAISSPPLPIIYRAIKKISTFLDFILNMEDISLLSFTINDWTRFIVVLTLSFRLSFPSTLCPDFDSAYARSELRLDQFLKNMSQGTDPTLQNDLLSVSRCMLGVAKSKYDLRLASLLESPLCRPVGRTFGCPLMSRNAGTPNLTESSGWTDGSQENKLPLFHDIWATMTMGW